MGLSGPRSIGAARDKVNCRKLIVSDEWYCEIMCSMLSAYGENQDVKSKVVQANPNAVSSQYDKWKAR